MRRAAGRDRSVRGEDDGRVSFPRSARAILGVHGRPIRLPLRVRGVARRCRADRGATSRPAKWTVPPVLVRQVRNSTVEAVHRGDIVEVDAAGRMLHVIGDPDRHRQPPLGDQAVRADRPAASRRPRASSTSRPRSSR